MRIVCAWCEYEGKAAEMGVREPLDDPTATHGLCPAHTIALLQERPDPMWRLSQLPGYIWQLEQWLQHLQTPRRRPWAQALWTKLDPALRDVVSTLIESPQPSHEGGVAALQAWIVARRIHTHIIHYMLQRHRMHIQQAQHRIERGRALLRARNIVRESAAATPPAPAGADHSPAGARWSASRRTGVNDVGPLLGESTEAW